MKRERLLDVKFRRYAWTGGDVPPKGERRRDPVYRQLCSEWFRDEIIDCGGTGLFVGVTETYLSWARIIWHRACADAWRTLNQ